MRAGAAAWLGRARIVLLALPMASLLLSPSARAQQAEARNHTRPWYATASHWGKWPMLAGAVGLAVAGIAQKHDADGVYDQLQELCRADSQDCILDESEHYVNPDAEALYQETLRLDGKARRWMLGGEVSLALSGCMFLIDLVAGHSEPRNIPFTPFEVYSAPDRLGLQLRF
jgi:hypothetical protein